MDLALTFHIGLKLRIPRTEVQQEGDMRILPFGPVFEKIEVGIAVTQAQSLADYQAVGVRCREALLELIGAAQDSAVWTEYTSTACELPVPGRKSSATICCRVTPTKSVAEPLRVRLSPHGRFQTG